MTDYQLSASDRMSIALRLGRDVLKAADGILASLRAGVRPGKAEWLALIKALHENGVLDFSDMPEFRKRRSCAAGHPASLPRSNCRPRA
jgi:hypothetical protein